MTLGRFVKRVRGLVKGHLICGCGWQVVGKAGMFYQDFWTVCVSMNSDGSPGSAPTACVCVSVCLRECVCEREKKHLYVCVQEIERERKTRT